MTRPRLPPLVTAALGAVLAACGSGESESGPVYTLQPGTYTITESSVGSSDGCQMIGSLPVGFEVTVLVDGAEVWFDVDSGYWSENVWPKATLAGNVLTTLPVVRQGWFTSLGANVYCDGRIWRDISGELTADDTPTVSLTQTIETSTADPDCDGLLPYDPTCTSEILFTITRTGP